MAIKSKCSHNLLLKHERTYDQIMHARVVYNGSRVFERLEKRYYEAFYGVHSKGC